MRLPSIRTLTQTAAALGAAGLVVLGTGAPPWRGAAATETPEPASDGAATPGSVPDLPAGRDRNPQAVEAERTLKGAELEAIQRNLRLSAERRAEIEAEIAAIDKDRANLNDRLLTTASRVQALEGSISAAEGRLARHADNEALIRGSLQGRRAILSEVLAAAQRIGRRPPPALVVRPEDALGAVRSAIVLGAVLPEIRVEADALASDLAALVQVRAEAEAERDRLRANAASFQEEQQRLALLLEEKKKLSAARAGDLARETQRAEELAREARTLEELMAAMEKELASVRDAEEAARDAARANRPSIGDSARLQPAIAFSAAKGLLSLPVRGVEVQKFGDDNGLGGAAAGLSIATRAGARVTAPADGWVVYAGDFRSYGQLLILNAGDGYHIVLAGMERIDVELGQFVLTGEPVGVMGSQRLASAALPDVSLSQPVLYIEFRKEGASIDPAPWWASSQDRKVRG